MVRVLRFLTIFLLSLSLHISHVLISIYIQKFEKHCPKFCTFSFVLHFLHLFLLFNFLTGEHPAAMSHNAASSLITTANLFSSHFRQLSFTIWLLLVAYTTKLLASSSWLCITTKTSTAASVSVVATMTMTLHIRRKYHQAQREQTSNEKQLSLVHSNSENNCSNHRRRSNNRQRELQQRQMQSCEKIASIAACNGLKALTEEAASTDIGSRCSCNRDSNNIQGRSKNNKCSSNSNELYTLTATPIEEHFSTSTVTKLCDCGIPGTR